jgi:hypothetical protein
MASEGTNQAVLLEVLASYWMYVVNFERDLEIGPSDESCGEGSQLCALACLSRDLSVGPNSATVYSVGRKVICSCTGKIWVRSL